MDATSTGLHPKIRELLRLTNVFLSYAIGQALADILFSFVLGDPITFHTYWKAALTGIRVGAGYTCLGATRLALSLVYPAVYDKGKTIWGLVILCYIAPFWILLIDYLLAFFTNTTVDSNLIIQTWVKRGSFRFGMMEGYAIFASLITEQKNPLLETVCRYAELAACLGGAWTGEFIWSMLYLGQSFHTWRHQAGFGSSQGTFMILANCYIGNDIGYIIEEQLQNQLKAIG
jgi:hypothetical protein